MKKTRDMKRTILISTLAATLPLVLGFSMQPGFSMQSKTASASVDVVQSVELDGSNAIELGDKRCYQCSKDSTGACKPGSNSYARCWGTKKECKAKGCTGMSGSSSSCDGYGANVPRC